MDIDYNKLKFFVTVVRCGGITAAAKKLFRTQSAVSQALISLEQQLGVKLFTWEGKRLLLTREGKLVYNATQERLQAIDEQLTGLKTSGQAVGGRIEIGMLNDASTNVLEHVFDTIAQFRNQYSGVTFKIRFDTSSGIEKALLDREIDLGFLINIREQHRFRITEIASEDHLIVTSAKYLEDTGAIDTVQDVVSRSLIDIDERFTCFSPWIHYHDALALEILEKKSPTIIVPNFLIVRKLVLAHQGIAVLPKYLVREDLADGTLIQVLPKLATLRVWVSCLTESGKQERLCEELFLKMLLT